MTSYYTYNNDNTTWKPPDCSNLSSFSEYGDNATFAIRSLCNVSSTVIAPLPCSSYNMSLEDWNMVMRAQRITYLVESHVQPLLFIVGVLANLLAIVIFYNMVMMKVCKTLMISLSITDLLTSLFGFLTIIIEVVNFHGNIPYGKWSVELMQAFISYKLFLMCLGMSSAIVIITSVLRAYSLRNPLKSRAKITHANVTKIIVVTIIVCLIVFLPTFIYAIWKACFDDIQHPVCAEYFRILPHADKARIYFSLMCILLGPGTVIANVVCSILLKQAINKSAREVKNIQSGAMASPHAVVNNVHHQNSSLLQSGRNQRLNRLILLVLITNTVCILPSCIQVVQVIIDPKTLIFDKCKLRVNIIDCVAEIFLAVLPSYNFFTFVLSNRDFRNKFKQVILRREVPATTPGNTPNWTPMTNTPNMTPKTNTPNMVPKHDAKARNGTPESLKKDVINMSLLNSTALNPSQSDDSLDNVSAETTLLRSWDSSPTNSKNRHSPVTNNHNQRQSLEMGMFKSKLKTINGQN